MEKTVRETIKSLTRKHLKESNGLVLGQCLSAVGGVGGTLPELYEEDGMVDLSMADVAAGAIVTGAALSGRKPIYVIRYQGFNWYNCPSIVNYACKSKEIWKMPCSMLVRGISMEGGIGPVAGSSHHSLYYRMPGIKIVSPMTSEEYTSVYEDFMNGDDVIYVSEHRKSYDYEDVLKDTLYEESDMVLFPISITRFAAEEAKRILEIKGYKISIAHQLWLKPFIVKDSWSSALKNSKYGGLVLDDDYADGIAKNIAHDLSLCSNTRIYTLGLEDKTAGFSNETDNLPPSAEKIVKYVLEIIKNEETTKEVERQHKNDISRRYGKTRINEDEK